MFFYAIPDFLADKIYAIPDFKTKLDKFSDYV